jgi:type I restriction enzyme, S subunit
MISGLKHYPAMRDSGVPWLGDVPESWNVLRGKRLFTPRTELARANDIQLSAT